MVRAAIRDATFPHGRQGADSANAPDTYVEPFVAYRAWKWTEQGVTSLTGSVWTPKQAFAARCIFADRLRSMAAAASSSAASKFWERHSHRVPDPDCSCGMYAGISMQHLIDIDYIGRGIHGEVRLWGRLYRHTLGWRAQYAYPKNFVVPVEMIPFSVEQAQKWLAALVEFGVEIYIQPEREARVGQQLIPLWMPDYGYSVQGIEFLVERSMRKLEQAIPRSVVR